jgi:hypothetical protein
MPIPEVEKVNMQNSDEKTLNGGPVQVIRKDFTSRGEFRNMSLL